MRPGTGMWSMYRKLRTQLSMLQFTSLKQLPHMVTICGKQILGYLCIFLSNMGTILSLKRACIELTPHIVGPQVVKIILEPSAMARLIAQVQLQHINPMGLTTS